MKSVKLITVLAVSVTLASVSNDASALHCGMPVWGDNTRLPERREFLDLSCSSFFNGVIRNGRAKASAGLRSANVTRVSGDYAVSAAYDSNRSMLCVAEVFFPDTFDVCNPPANRGNVIYHDIALDVY